MNATPKNAAKLYRIGGPACIGHQLWCVDPGSACLSVIGVDVIARIGAADADHRSGIQHRVQSSGCMDAARVVLRRGGAPIDAAFRGELSHPETAAGLDCG